jgi:hypothetical protein
MRPPGPPARAFLFLDERDSLLPREEEGPSAAGVARMRGSPTASAQICRHSSARRDGPSTLLSPRETVPEVKRHERSKRVKQAEQRKPVKRVKQ